MVDVGFGVGTVSGRKFLKDVSEEDDIGDFENKTREQDDIDEERKKSPDRASDSETSEGEDTEIGENDNDIQT